MWGALHGLEVAMLVFAHARNWRILAEETTPQTAFRIALTFAFFTFAWIFFSANSLSDAAYIVTHLFMCNASFDLTSPMKDGLLGRQIEWWLNWGLFLLLLVIDHIDASIGIPQALARTPTIPRWLATFN